VRDQLPKEDLKGAVRGNKAPSRGQNRAPQTNQSLQSANLCGRCKNQGPHNRNAQQKILCVTSVTNLDISNQHAKASQYNKVLER